MRGRCLSDVQLKSVSVLETAMESSPESKRTACFPCGFRYVVVTLAFWVSVLCYILRSSFSVALVAMVNISRPEEIYHNSSCVEHDSSQNQSTSVSTNVSIRDEPTAKRLGEKYDWDLKTQSSLLAALFYGCTASQMLSAVLIQRFGIRWLFGIATLISSVLSLATPAAASWGATAVFAIRFVQGLLQGSVTSVQSQTISFWSPVMERSRGMAFLLNGNMGGVVIAMAFSGILAVSPTLGGWPSIFYVFGAIGCFLSVLWVALVTDSPQQHPCISDSELKLIQEGKQDTDTTNSDIPWKYIFTSVPVWSYILSTGGYGIGFFLLMTEMPMYLTKVLHFDIRASGGLSTLPFLLRMLSAAAGGQIADALRRSGKLSIGTIRKMMSTIGFFGISLCFLAIPLVGCRSSVIVSLLCMSCVFAGMTIAGCLVTIVDLSPRFSATITGISNTFAFMSGILVPYVVAIFTSTGDTMENWSKVFYFSAAVVFASGLLFLTFGSGERQPWDFPKPTEVAVSTNIITENGIQKTGTTRF